MEKIALVTGSSSGIGFETALALARENYFTFASMRNTDKAGKIQEIAKKEKKSLSNLQ
jgi:NAD(P)-dependent dehydrogenase (short-subunit alcohol dehydrogenase family)